MENILNLSMTNNIKEWYISEYPTDELGSDINPAIRFYDVVNVLNDCADIYIAIGVGDSLVRERIFAKLAEILEVDYNTIYDMWIVEKTPSIKVTVEEMTMVNKLKSGYWVTETTGMGYMWHIEGSVLDHKATDNDLRILKQLVAKGLVDNENLTNIN